MEAKNVSDSKDNTNGRYDKKKEFFIRKSLRVIKIAGMVIGGIVLAVFLGFVFGIAVKWLWNNLMPGLFGLPVITYWQAVGLVVLSKILFGSFHGHGHDEGHFHKKRKTSFRTCTDTHNSNDDSDETKSIGSIIKNEIKKEIVKELEKEFEKKQECGH